MFRIDDATAVTSLPVPEVAGTPGYFSEGNPGAGQPATNVRGSFLNMLQEELMNVILAAGTITPSKTTYNQLLAAIRALGGNFNQLYGAASGQRPVTDVGSVNIQIATGATSQAVPLSTAVLRGARMDFVNSTAVNMTLTCQGADAFILLGNTYTTLVLQPGEALTVSSNAAGAWYGVGGNLLNRYCAQFTASLATSGYQKLPSGLIIQWGNGTYTAQQTTLVNFPLVFPNACLAMTASLGYSIGTTTNNIGIGAQAASASQFRVTIASTGTGSTGIGWIAVGY